MNKTIFTILLVIFYALFFSCGGEDEKGSSACTPDESKLIDASAFDSYKITKLFMGVNFTGATTEGIDLDSTKDEVIAAYGNSYTIEDHCSGDSSYYLSLYDGGDLEFEWECEDDDLIAIGISGNSSVKIEGYGMGSSYGEFRTEYGNPSSIAGTTTIIMQYTPTFMGGGNCFWGWVYLKP